MESASWRNYRGHLIIARKTWLGRRHDVWRHGRLLATFRDAVAAERHVDARTRPGPQRR